MKADKGKTEDQSKKTETKAENLTKETKETEKRKSSQPKWRKQ